MRAALYYLSFGWLRLAMVFVMILLRPVQQVGVWVLAQGSLPGLQHRPCPVCLLCRLAALLLPICSFKYLVTNAYPLAECLFFPFA